MALRSFVSCTAVGVVTLAAATLSGTAIHAEAPVAGASVSAAEFSRRPFFEIPALSPGGSLVAARINAEAGEMLGIFRVDEGAPKPLAQVPLADHQDIRWLRWATDRYVLLSIGLVKRKASGDSHGTRLFAYDLAKGEFRLLGTVGGRNLGDDVLYVAPDGSYLLLTQSWHQLARPGVIRVSLEDGSVAPVTKPISGVRKWFADRSGQVRLGVGYDGLNLRMHYRDPGEEKFRVISNISLDKLQGDFDGFGFTEGDHRGYVITNSLTGRYAAYHYDFRTQEIGEPIFESTAVDLERLLFDELGGRIIGAVFTDDRPRIAWLDDRLKTAQAEVDSALEGRVNRIVSWSDDFERMLVWTATASDPGHYYLYRRRAGVMTRLATPYEWLRGKALGEVRPVTYRARDGLEISGYLTIPPQAHAGRRPAVILPHARPHGRDTWTFDVLAQFLASRGYLVLQPNYRGSGGYGVEFLDKGIGEWGGGIQRDLVDGAAWLVTEGLADPERICIGGLHFGGSAALLGAIQSPEVFRCAFSASGATDLDRLLRRDRFLLWPSRYHRWRNRLLGEGVSNARHISPVRMADRIRIPLLLMHAREDALVPYSHAEAMVKALTRARVDFEFDALEAGLYFDREDNLEWFLLRIEAFLAKHNPPGELPAEASTGHSSAAGPDGVGDVAGQGPS